MSLGQRRKMVDRVPLTVGAFPGRKPSESHGTCLGVPGKVLRAPPWEETSAPVAFCLIANDTESSGRFALRVVRPWFRAPNFFHYCLVSIRIAAMRRAVSVKCRTSSGSRLRLSTLCSRYDSHFLRTW